LKIIIGILVFNYKNVAMRTLSKFLAAILIICSVQALDAQIRDFRKIKWDSEKIAPGIEWRSTHAILYDSVPQNINILIVNTKKRGISLYYSPEKNVRTSELAAEADALAAINAGFFNVKLGGSVTYIRVDGRIMDKDTASKWQRVPNMNGALLVDNKGDVFIDRVMPNSWYDSHPEYEDVLVTGCLLLKSGIKVTMPETSLVINRHPRSVIGLQGKDRVILLTLDGRAAQAAGMTLPEIADLMVSLKCYDAVNLDGGGSTTMWIKGKPFSGVVNMPSDNKIFDHEGERAVSNIILVR
jgi:exopolysaccharide biosynthesis protein